MGGWILIIMLLVAVPNAQWGNLKFASFDKREHVGIGAWSACSKMYETETVWATAPPTCDSSTLEMCAEMIDCFSDSFANQPGANEAYEKSWQNCTSGGATCLTREWEAHCASMNCGGSLHAEQCRNVSRAVQRSYNVQYGPLNTVAWAAGDHCRPASFLCDNAGTIEHAGNLAIFGLILSVCGEVLLLLYQALREKRNMRPALMGSLASFVTGWGVLLVSWTIFAGAVGSDATCVIMDTSRRGAVSVTAPFGDIINGRGSYSYSFVIGAWVLLLGVIALVTQRALYEIVSQRDTPKKAEAVLAEATPDTSKAVVAEATPDTSKIAV